MIKPTLIAEIGVNHDGNIEKAKELVLLAKLSGADLVKFQTFSASKLANQQTPKVAYQTMFDSDRSHFQMLKELELSRKDHTSLIDFCNQNEIEFFSTPYSAEDACFLFDLGVKRFKTASADIVDLKLHKTISSFGLQTLVSTGMATNQEIIKVLEIYRNANCPIVLMHAVSEYPCPIDKSNILRLNFLKSIVGTELGYSDHTEGYVSALVAVGLGAVFFEKHFTKNRNDKGPDHRTSMTPDEFRSYSDNIRQAVNSLGSEGETISNAEIEMRRVSRKSLVYASDFAKGYAPKERDFDLMRPGIGLYWSAIEEVVDKKLGREVKKGDLVSYSDFE